jgi:poly(A) polymerase
MVHLPVGTDQRIAALLARPHVAKVLGLLNDGSHSARLVGGAVRNVLLGREAADIDIATTWLPQEVMSRASAAGIKSVGTGIDHGTVTLVVGGLPLEVTTLREDIATDGRHAQVKFGHDYDADARRRDFTINAMSLSLDGVVHDVVGGLHDLTGPVVRFIGDPAARIAEDYLRILRFFRFHAHFCSGMPTGPDLEACIRARSGLGSLSRERIRIELLKLLSAEHPADAASALSRSGIWTMVTGTVLSCGRLVLAVPLTENPVERLAVAAVLKREDAVMLSEVLRLSNAEESTLMLHAQALESLAGRDAPDRQRIMEVFFAFGAPATRTALIALGLLTGTIRDEFNFISAQPPVDPFAGAAVVARGVLPGPQIGMVLNDARQRWIEGGFSPDPVIHNALLDDAIRNLAL